MKMKEHLRYIEESLFNCQNTRILLGPLYYLDADAIWQDVVLRDHVREWMLAVFAMPFKDTPTPKLNKDGIPRFDRRSLYRILRREDYALTVRVDLIPTV